MDVCAKLPSLIKFDDYDGNWEEYENALYSIFRSTFIENKQYFQGKPVGIFTDKMYHGKEKTFWHVISEGKNEFNRIPEMRRCERITWIESFINLLTCNECKKGFKMEI